MKQGRRERRQQAEFWVAEYESWRGSGLSQVAFCKERGYSAGTLKTRLTKLRHLGRIAPGKAWKAKSEFAAVRLDEGALPVKMAVAVASDGPYCEIRFRDGGRLVIEESVGIERLRELLSVNAR